jgi:hypothetical protein
VKDWRSVALIALVSILLGRESAQTQNMGSQPSDLTDPHNPIQVRIVSPVPVVLVSPENPPAPVKPPAPVNPGPAIDLLVPDTPLGRSGRSYIRIIKFALPEIWKAMADKIEKGEITDKSGAVRLHNQLSASLNSSMDQIFTPGIDSKGRITNPSVIVDSLRQSAAALGRSD